MIIDAAFLAIYRRIDSCVYTANTTQHKQTELIRKIVNTIKFRFNVTSGKRKLVLLFVAREEKADCWLQRPVPAC